MTRLYRTLLGIQSGPPVGTFAVTFTVKEWMLDPDNDFTDTEVDVLPYMTVKIDGVEQLTDANGQTTFNLTPGTHTYEVYDMVRYLTTVKGEVTVVDASVAVGVKIYACLYTPTQVSEMISVEGYVPVASATELDGLRNAVTQTMGVGTIWEDNYTTGLDEKYVHVRNIDLSGYLTGEGWNPYGNFAGILDGNNLSIDNLYCDRPTVNFQSFIGVCELNHTVQNLRLVNVNIIGKESIGGISSSVVDCLYENIYVTGEIEASTFRVGGITSRVNGNSIEIKDCHFAGTITASATATSGWVGGICGVVESTASASIVEYCSVSDSIISGSVHVGGICGENYGIIKNSEVVNCDISGSGHSTGGCIGYNRKTADKLQNIGSIVANTSGMYGCGGIAGTAYQAQFSQCASSGTVNHSGTGSNGCGGIVGVLRASTIDDSHSSCNVTGVSNVGGAFGQHRDSTSANCYSRGTVVGTTAVGGYAGLLTGSNTFLNCYYDSDTSGQSDTGKGEPRTTAQMKAGTADSFINPDGTIDATQDPDNAMYTDWDDTIWDFTDTNEYPELL